MNLVPMELKYSAIILGGNFKIKSFNSWDFSFHSNLHENSNHNSFPKTMRRLAIVHRLSDLHCHVMNIMLYKIGILIQTRLNWRQKNNHIHTINIFYISVCGCVAKNKTACAECCNRTTHCKNLVIT